MDVETAVVVPSLRSSFAWTFAGNAANAAGQWALLSLIAKLGSTQMLGEYALAAAVAMPISMFAHMNLRAVLATDVSRRHPFGDYLAVRLAVAALGVAAAAAIAYASGYRGHVAAAITAAALWLAVDSMCDLYHGALQRRERLDVVGRSLMLRSGASVIAFGAALAASRDLLLGLAAFIGARAAVLVLYDRPRGSRGEDPARTSVRAQAGILSHAVPLGLVLMLISLTANLPRYAIERSLGTRELGAFAAVASFITVGTTVVHALGQSAMARLARHFVAQETPAFRRLGWRLAAIALGLGGAGVLAAVALGPLVLRLLYRREYAVYSGLLIAMLAAGTCTYIGVMLGYVLTSTRAFGRQMPLLACVAAASGIVSWVLVPRIGLWGGAVAIAAAGCVQIVGNLLLLRHRMGAA